ncbi:hypothetical protein BC829DRAFT_286536 [Chytridium lagenaria]|nr:hypothetical protein BC829DRAFT_286536 [Chytridium lagenaria]
MADWREDDDHAWDDIGDDIDFPPTDVGLAVVTPLNRAALFGLTVEDDEPDHQSRVSPTNHFNTILPKPSEGTVKPIMLSHSTLKGDSTHTVSYDMGSSAGFEKWSDDPSLPAEIKYPRRYRASPSPSSNTSVVASEGEEDEGFDDIEIPEQLGNIIKRTDKVAEATHGRVGGGTLITVPNTVKPASSFWNDTSDDLCDDIEIPEGFGWKRVEKDLQCDATKKRIPDNATPSKIPVLKKMSLPMPPSRDIAGLGDARWRMMQGMNHYAAPPPPQPQQISIPVSGVFFSDGTELDAFDDLSTNSYGRTEGNGDVRKGDEGFKAATIEKVPLSSSTQRLGTHVSLRQPASYKKPSKAKKKPTLIRKTSLDLSKTIGGMTFNASLQQWEGNEEVLLEFDKAATSISKLRPALITQHGFSKKMPQVVGSMIFDPVKMKWIGNEEEDVFADLDEDNLSDSTARTGMWTCVFSFEPLV